MLLMTLPNPPASAPLHWVQPDHPRLQWRGRWRVERERAFAVNTGSRLLARFSGERIALRFDTTAYPHEPPQLWVRLDVQPWQAVEVAPQIELTPALAQPSHQLEVVFKGAGVGQPLAGAAADRRDPDGPWLACRRRVAGAAAAA